MGDCIDPKLPGDWKMRVEVGWQGKYFDSTNRLPDEKAAFNLLHLLHHLNGAASDSFDALSRLNPTIVRALIQHHRALSSAYRLYFERYDAKDDFNDLHRVLRPLLPTDSDARPGCNVDAERFIHLGELRFHSLQPDGMLRLKEILTTAGAYCRKMRLYMYRYTNQHFNEVLEVGSAW